MGYNALMRNQIKADHFDLLSRNELLSQLEPGQLNELLSIADVVLLSCPCTAETHQLMNPERFACMKRTALLINVARGELVDETALVHALENETIQGAGIDVCQTEPLPANSPLWDVPNLVITPHSAGYSPERRNRLVEFFSKNLRRYLAGETLMNIVDPETGYPKPNDFC